MFATFVSRRNSQFALTVTEFWGACNTPSILVLIDDFDYLCNNEVSQTIIMKSTYSSK